MKAKIFFSGSILFTDDPDGGRIALLVLGDPHPHVPRLDWTAGSGRRSMDPYLCRIEFRWVDTVGHELAFNSKTVDDASSVPPGLRAPANAAQARSFSWVPDLADHVTPGTVVHPRYLSPRPTPEINAQISLQSGKIGTASLVHEDVVFLPGNQMDREYQRVEFMDGGTGRPSSRDTYAEEVVWTIDSDDTQGTGDPVAGLKVKASSFRDAADRPIYPPMASPPPPLILTPPSAEADIEVAISNLPFPGVPIQAETRRRSAGMHFVHYYPLLCPPQRRPYAYPAPMFNADGNANNGMFSPGAGFPVVPTRRAMYPIVPPLCLSTRI